MPVYLELTQFIEQSIHLIVIQKPHHPHSESRKVANPQSRKIRNPAVLLAFSLAFRGLRPSLSPKEVRRTNYYYDDCLP